MTDRRAFMKMSLQSFVDTVKEVAHPFLEDKSEKWEAIQQQLEGKMWVEVSALGEEEKLAQRLVGRHLLFLSRDEKGQVEAIIGKCPSCLSSLSLRKMDLTLLCLPCNKSERLPTGAEKVFDRLPFQQTGDKWMVEVRKADA